MEIDGEFLDAEERHWKSHQKALQIGGVPAAVLYLSLSGPVLWCPKDLSRLPHTGGSDTKD